MSSAYLRLALACFALSPTQAFAASLISFTDNSFSTSVFAPITDTVGNWAVSWTQTIASSNVSVRAILSSNVGPTSGSWYVTNSIGAGTTAANIIGSGTYNIAGNLGSGLNFNPLQRTTLGTGLNFAAGTYHLVLDGQPGLDSYGMLWVGDVRTNVTINTASGFSVGSYKLAVPAVAFAPASTFSNVANQAFVFELEELQGSVPEPTTWAMMILGFGTIGGVLRRRVSRTLTAFA